MALPLALTMGEPAGIGGEIALRAWLRRGEGVPPFYVIDDPGRLAALARCLGWDVPVCALAAPQDAARGATHDALRIFPEALPVLPVGRAPRAAPGRPDRADAPLVIGAIDAAVAEVRAGRAAAVVTNPINKDALYRAGFRHPGHTEYLAELAGTGRSAVMMLACQELRVVPVTIHLALRQVVEQLSAAAIVHAGRVTNDALIRDFGVPRPVLAVAGLNPHAGEAGALGREDIDIIAPAIAELRAAGIDARGPLAADTMFHAEARQGYDAALCMYHDQALIPVKTLDFHGAVNVTLGLPFIRTSPDHGTAFDIAGQGVARPDSLIAALKLAARMAALRQTGAVDSPENPRARA
jgi:4-hydroxythreonine-4-phosphate dehydrogenase